MSCRSFLNASSLDDIDGPSAGLLSAGDDDVDVELGSTTSSCRLPLGAADDNDTHTRSAMAHVCKAADKPAAK